MEDEQKGSVTDRESTSGGWRNNPDKILSISKAVELGLKRGEISETEMESLGLGMRRKREGYQAGL